MNHRTHAQATNGFLAQHLAEKVKEQPQYRPIDIIKDVQRDLGVKVSYSTAFRIKTRANEINNGTHESLRISIPFFAKILSRP